MADDWTGYGGITDYGLGSLDSSDYGYVGQNFDTSNFGNDVTLSDPELGTNTSTYDNFDINKDYVSEIPNTAGKGEVGYGWKYYENGTAISPDGKYYKDGQLVYDPATNEGMLAKLGTKAVTGLKNMFTTKDAKGNDVTDWRKVIGAGAAALSGAQSMGLFGGNSNSGSAQTHGYQGKIPTYTAVRSPVAGAFAAGKAGDPNRRYFSDLVYTTPENLTTAQTDTKNQATGIATLQDAADKQRAADLKTAQAAAAAAAPKKDSATPTNDWQTNINNAITSLQNSANSTNSTNSTTVKKATGGLAGLKSGKYLQGSTDGMADKLRTSIDGGQPAALSHGEFVIPADVVSHLGNGNSDAGAKRLYAMMDKVRQARTGTKKQGKQIYPNKYMLA
jgi:hypothetical protein